MPQVNYVQQEYMKNMTSYKELGLIKQQLGLDRPWQSYH